MIALFYKSFPVSEEFGYETTLIQGAQWYNIERVSKILKDNLRFDGTYVYFLTNLRLTKNYSSSCKIRKHM